MKYTLRNILTLLLIFVATLSSSIYSNEDKWGLQIELAKQVYVSHEPIYLDITLTNITSDTLRTHGLETPQHRGFMIYLIDGNGHLMEHTGVQFSFASTPGRLLLEAGEQDYSSFDLTQFFESEENSGYSVMRRRLPYIPKGTYTVQAVLEGAESNALTLSIVEPSGEEIDVLELIEEASRIWRRDNTDPSAQIFRDIVETSPSSVFAERCSYLSIYYTKTVFDGMRQGTFDIRTIKREMIRKYPNTGRSKVWLQDITREMDDSTKLDYLNELVENNPNTRSSKSAQQMRRRMLIAKEEE